MTILATGEVLRVPDDYATIQAALNNVTQSDTVLVSLGEYQEALLAPALSFWLIGDVPPDTGVYPRPVVDASLPPDFWDSGCLYAPPGSHVRVERMHFRNRLDMIDQADFGGIYSTADDISFTNCLFDSLFRGVSIPDTNENVIVLRRCVSRHARGNHVLAIHGTVIAENCEFSGGAAYQIFASTGTQLFDCRFRDNAGFAILGLAGDAIMIRSCVFGPSAEPSWSVLDLSGFNGLIGDNLFYDLRYGYKLMILQPFCGEACQVSGNVFTNVARAMGNGFAAPLNVSCFPGTFGHRYVVQNNSFVSCSSYASGATSCWLEDGQGMMVQNRFFSNRPTVLPALLGETADSTVIEQNMFMDNGYGAAAWSGTLDARWNWWGDSSGPHHPELNPSGLGDEVGDNVLFDPWYPDTNAMSVNEHAYVLPTGFSLTAYPNPFNAECRLRIKTPEPGMYELALYNIEGRRVQTIWQGAVGYEREIRFDASALPSGLYFVHAIEVLTRRAVAATKLILLN